MAESKYLNEYYRNPYLQRRSYLNPGASFAPSVYVPEQADLSLLARSLDKIEERELATSQQETAIAKMLGDLDMNAAEDVWRTNYANQLNNRIKALVDVGDYSNAMTTAVKTAKDIYLNPAVRGRIRANQEYKKFVEETQRRQDIDQRTKNWALATNPYSYEDITDENGNIVGGSEWKPSNTPVSQIDLTTLASKALSWVKPTKTGGTSAMFVDAEGNFTKDLSKAVDVAYTTTSGTEYLGKNKLKQAINAAIDMTPGARASLEQDYKVAEWEYNNLPNEQKKSIGESEFTDTNGRTLTKEEFIAKKINPWIDAAAYSNSESRTTYGSGLSTRMAARQQAAANNLFNNQGLNYTGTGFNITYDTSDYVASAQGAIEDAIKSIEGAMPAGTNTKQWKEAKAAGDYLKLESIIRNAKMKGNKNYFNATSPKAQEIVNKALRTINNNYSFVADTFKGTDKDTKQAILFKAAIDAGQKLPDNNENSRTFYGLLSDISGGKPADSYRITFNDKSDVDDFLNRMGMNESTARQNGLDFGYDDGFTTVTIKQSSNLLPKAVMNFFDANDDFFSIPWHRSKITALDSDGREIGNRRRGTLLDNLGERLTGSWTTANHFNSLKNIVNNKVNKFNSSGVGTRSTDQIKVTDIPGIADAKVKYGIESQEYARVKKEINNDLALRLSGSDWTQFNVYGYDENTRGLTVMPNADRGEQMSNIIGHIQNDKADIQFGTNGIQHGYYVTLHEKLDKSGNVDASSKPKTYFIASGVEDEAMDRFITDSNTRAMAEYNRRRGVSGSYRTYMGNNITNISNDSAKIDGKLKSRTEAVKIIERDKLIDDVVNGLKNGTIPVRNEQELNTIIGNAMQHIINETSVTNNEDAIKIMNIIYNKLK